MLIVGPEMERALTENETTGKKCSNAYGRVLRGCPEGRMDKESLRAACVLLAQIEDMQAALRLLQHGELSGELDAEGEVILRTKDDV
jgi:hypothetical protein